MHKHGEELFQETGRPTSQTSSGMHTYMDLYAARLVEKDHLFFCVSSHAPKSKHVLVVVH